MYLRFGGSGLMGRISGTTQRPLIRVTLIASIQSSAQTSRNWMSKAKPNLAKISTSNRSSGVRIRSLSPQRCWQAVIGRDAHFDGVFVYGVRSTGIFCRPSCPSRRPHRKYVTFFANSEAAERQGFRACLRCHPQEGTHERTSGVGELIRRICVLIERNSDGPPVLAEIAKEAAMHPARLQRIFQKFTGISVRAYADAVRVRRLKQQLRKGNDVTTALYEAGFGSPSRLYEYSDRHLGMTPATYGRGGKGMEIRYATAKIPLGRILLAGTERGISAIYLGESDAPLVAALHKEYPQADIRHEPARVSPWIRTVVSHLAGERPPLDLPIDVAATAFQRRVWEALQGIPYGTTQSYSEVARRLGRPTATRAVARACATNPISVLVPCHRVLRENGALGGYRWGLERKQALIDAERRNCAGSNRNKCEPGNQSESSRNAQDKR